MESRWTTMVDDLDARFATEPSLLEELGRLQGGDNAFPEDLLLRGRQIFETAVAIAGKRLCADPTVRFLLSDSGPRTSEVLTIVPLLLNLLPGGSLDDASIALVAIMIVRMGLGAFCDAHGRPPP